MRMRQVEQFIVSGMPAAEWMRLNCMSSSTFYLCFKKFRKAGLPLWDLSKLELQIHRPKRIEYLIDAPLCVPL